MNQLDEQTKARIRAEEEYRAQVRAEAEGKATPPPQPPQKPEEEKLGCLATVGVWVIGTIMVLLIVGLVAQFMPVDEGAVASPSGIEASAVNVDPWPLTFPSGRLECHNRMVTITKPDGEVIALNGTASAKAAVNGWIPLKESTYWAGGEAIKVNLGPLIERGLSLCK